MIMTTKIETLEQLRSEIRLLKLKKAEDELYFHQKKEHYKKMLTSPFASLKKAGSYLGFGNSEKDTYQHDPKNADWATTVARVFIPFLLNTTVLRGKGIIMKSLMTLFSQRVINSQNFNQNVLSKWIDKATDLVNSSRKKKPVSATAKLDYGIPPDSETY